MGPSMGSVLKGNTFGDGSLDGQTFWVGCGWDFLISFGKDGDGEEEMLGPMCQGFFSLYDPCFQTVKWNEVLNYCETLTYISYM